MKTIIALLEEVENGRAHFVPQEKGEKDLYVSETLLPKDYQVGSLYSIEKKEKDIVFKRMKGETEAQLNKVSEKRKKLLDRSQFKK